MRLFTARDLDGFFGLFIDNLVQLLLILALGQSLCGMTGEAAHLLTERVLPGAALSILIGNLFYSYQAIALARREGRDDVTALPYGINTPSLLVYVFFVMAPAYERTKNAEFAWGLGLIACLGSGVIELFGSLVAERVRRATPRAALLSTLAGIAMTFIAMSFTLTVWTRPLVAMAPMAIVFLTYFSHVRFPLGLPGGLISVVVGSLLAWLLPSEWTGMSLTAADLSAAWSERRLEPSHWLWPQWFGGTVFELARSPSQWLGLLSVIIPMGLFTVVGSLQNIESAEAAGDRFDTRAALAVNGVGTIAAALFGSCFPTTLYIGHPGWKALGARAGYSVLNGVAVTLLCLTGTVVLISRLAPIEAGVGIVLWIGVVITAQAFQAVPRNHAPAVAVGLFPSIAAWGATVVLGAFFAAGGKTAQAVLEARPGVELSGFLLHGLLVFERGFIFTCMILAAMVTLLIQRRFRSAALWSFLAAAITATGLMHAYQLVGNQLDFWLIGAPPTSGALTYHGRELVVAYMLTAVGLWCMPWLASFHEDPADNADPSPINPQGKKGLQERLKENEL